ncbi:unnamed protein product, partial [Polarella glacialis]
DSVECACELLHVLAGPWSVAGELGQDLSPVLDRLAWLKDARQTQIKGDSEAYSARLRFKIIGVLEAADLGWPASRTRSRPGRWHAATLGPRQFG